MPKLLKIHDLVPGKLYKMICFFSCQPKAGTVFLEFEEGIRSYKQRCEKGVVAKVYPNFNVDFIEEKKEGNVFPVK